MKAQRLLRSKLYLSETIFVDLKIWRVPKPVRGSDHCYKYSLALVEKDHCVLRYDNEAGKATTSILERPRSPIPRRSPDTAGRFLEGCGTMAGETRKTVTIGVQSLDDAKRQVAASFRGEGQGDHISFVTLELLSKMLTAKRWEILQAMTGQGALSIRDGGQTDQARHQGRAQRRAGTRDGGHSGKDRGREGDLSL